MTELLDKFGEIDPWDEPLDDGAVVLRSFALPKATELWEAVQAVYAQTPCRHMTTPGGFQMSAALTNCGRYGWVSDSKGYRYTTVDPLDQKPWPQMPGCFIDLAVQAASRAGFIAFQPDACLINSYQSGAKMSLHQDKDEQDFTQPIVSVSLGIPATFLWGGLQRKSRTTKIELVHGDVVVWGGASRFHYHGILPIKQNHHSLKGNCRINLTFRRAR